MTEEVPAARWDAGPDLRSADRSPFAGHDLGAVLADVRLLIPQVVAAVGAPPDNEGGGQECERSAVSLHGAGPTRIAARSHGRRRLH